MKPQAIKGATRNLVKPSDWDDSKGTCGGLPIRDEERAYGNVMISEWKPTEEELSLLNEGGTIQLSVVGEVHPPVAVYVEPNPEQGGPVDLAIHHVELNIPFGPGAVCPDEDKPAVMLDGKPFDGVTEITLHADTESLAQVGLRFYASVKGNVDAAVAEKTV